MNAGDATYLPKFRVEVGDGNFGTQMKYLAGSEPNSVHAGDVDLDGTPDIVVTSYADETFSILLNLGDGHFGEANHNFSRGFHTTLDLVDLDLDGDLVVVLADADTGWARVHLNSCAGSVSRTSIPVAV